MFHLETPDTVSSPAPSAILLDTRVVAVLRAKHAKDYSPVIEALRVGGVLSIELTLSTPGVFEELPLLLDRFGDAVEIGVGTVTTPAEAETALDLGAAYIVTPITEPDVITACTRRGVPVFPGGLTPTELHTGWKLGATAVKLFPASTVGPGYISQLRGPFPEIQVVPSGGLTIEDVPAWIRAGALAVSLGGPLLGDAFKGGSLPELTTRARRVRNLVDGARESR
ncbi:bifunctional 4-hydroxy-2-oxoglutarate aldolase/2-dehydro-3-deoxy-phosphogluconate aldolase [Arthrobacter bambusae]|uniref:2-dehydro-3-deoxyphosphogluconate aldolase/(4S)-4-hydroxy-2-oxoglutarate aldolase n=1 Tax=Arthrobacter bambusae TaxID=1338426 RepID=A0AAW8DFM6_9MICC|nr:bifunctional 4-hydroxy-2-oxoglutarate aldolase/2-dehydro-3-deoxy-phosphogluconate aldolase [Arthrobacter bambusae]MDP9904120.1 2-dehydro-3-deoxyphosphogluconate aldolase/(4S)-4-hydroxy-2-oxoglutarate aldolase [Arthrobacter bambusae]MDQ0127884.1 2-dehydro-3-deoxyphosphogluconate aldolase/(4S)-4-hydroxy-2-oxoglutarate aldolase [Arthrobacter bambusae]MDQ0179226.1 2-dehydro-3-deoxyphosphogluconate aldolase/(4S)-4-hydroxy-2-oxoglutarate aldolase [Arthrobacter bambusae]